VGATPPVGGLPRKASGLCAKGHNASGALSNSHRDLQKRRQRHLSRLRFVKSGRLPRRRETLAHRAMQHSGASLTVATVILSR
jgi:hypothetical protein